VHVDDALRPGLLVEIVHILCTEEQAISQSLLKTGERDVRRVGFRRRRDAASHGVELPDQPGIAMPRMRRSNLFDSVVAPQSADASEGRYPALGAYACPGEDEDPIRGRDGEHGSSVPSLCSESALLR
jgi:hypothetical protein